MTPETFVLNGDTIHFVEEIGRHMPGGFFIYKAEQPEELIFANDAVFEIFGCRDLDEFKELTGYTFRGMLHPEDYAAVTDSINDQIASSDDNMDYAEYRIIRKDGEVRWVDDYGHYTETDAFGGIYYVFISDITEKHEQRASDIAEHKAAIKSLSEENERLEEERFTFGRIAQALSADYFSIYIVDLATDRFEEYSAADSYGDLNIEKSGEDFFNISRRNMDRVICPKDKERFMEVFTKDNILAMIERDGHFTLRYRLMLGDEEVYVSLKVTLLEDELGRHLILGTSNITPQVRREQEYEKSLENAREKARNDFLANMSHDIRTPMNAIVGYTNIASANPDDKELVKDSLEKIGSSSHFLLSLINDILDISKIESGMMRLQIAECDLADIFSRIEDITRLQAKNKDLDISYDKSGVTHTLVKADELRIEQILINITSNAIKYTQEGGKVMLSAFEEDSPFEGKRRYRFVVRDTGVGISEEYLPHIFDSFTREHNTKTNRIQGTGLGLAITANIVRLMGGDITVKSRPGEGSEFTVTLDLEMRGEGSGQAGESAQGPADLSGRRLLLVEDNDINAEIAAMVLSTFGAECERAVNGRVGFDMVREAGPGYYDAVLMDIQMPVMSGYEATRAIRALDGDYFRTVPIIAMSANAYDEDVRLSIESGMNAHVAKPFDPDQLAATIAKFL